MLDILLPNRCVLCGESINRGNVCSQCTLDFNPLSGITTCSSCGVPLGMNNINGNIRCGPCINQPYSFISAISVYLYEGNLRKLLQMFKYENIYHLDKFFAEHVSRGLVNQISEDTILIPVPLHINKLRQRRYNQSVLLCIELSRLIGCSCDLFTLKKRLDTRPQVELKNFVERAANVRNAYFIEKSDSIRRKNIMLIDDVFTSGSTVNECSKVLMDGGVESVRVLTVARSVHH